MALIAVTSASFNAASPSSGASARLLAAPALFIRFPPRALFLGFGICCSGARHLPDTSRAGSIALVESTRAGVA